MRGLDKEAKGGDFGADAGVLDKWFAKGVALAGVIVCIFGADTGKPESSSCETKALRIEIRHYESESAVDGSDDIVERDMDVFECDVGGALCKRHSELQEED